MIIVQKTDFVGQYQLAQSIADTPLLQSTIDRYEKGLIIRLLGVPLGTLFIADLVAGVPVAARFTTIFNPAFYQNGNQIRETLGIKAILLAAIYYHYIFDTQARQGQSGVVTQQSENATVLSPMNAARLGERAYNSVIDTWDNIQWYINTHTDVYPEYSPAPGEEIKAKFSLLL